MSYAAKLTAHLDCKNYVSTLALYAGDKDVASQCCAQSLRIAESNADSIWKNITILNVFFKRLEQIFHLLLFYSESGVWDAGD